MKAPKVNVVLLIAALLGYSHAHSNERMSETGNAVPLEQRSSEDVLTNSDFTKERYEDEIGAIDSSTRRVFVKYVDAAGRQTALAAASTMIKEFEKHRLLVLHVDDEMYSYLESHTQIEEIELDNAIEAFSSHSDSKGFLRHSRSLNTERSLSEQMPYGISMIQADQLSVGDHSVTVCIVDSGYALGHPDLPTTATGDDVVTEDGEVRKWDRDMSGHGTQIAGIIAAIAGNDEGVAGAGNIPIHITRGLDDYAGGYESDVLLAVQQCVDAGAKVVSISLGGPTISNNAASLYTRLVEEEGILVVAAAGNTGTSSPFYPASHPSVISVSAVYQWGSLWQGSSYNDQVELAAPGYQILTTSVSASSVRTDDFSYPAIRVLGSRNKEVTGNLVNCGPGNYRCNEAAGGICIMFRDETALDTMLQNCANGRGKGAVIFNADGAANTALSSRISIPAVSVTQADGMKLLNMEGSRVTIGLTFAQKDPEYTYDYATGTSLATPHVSAAAALVWSHFPQCSNHQIRYALAVTAQDKGFTGCDRYFGYGIVKAKNAYDYLASHDCSNGAVWNTPSQGGCTTVPKK